MNLIFDFDGVIFNSHLIKTKAFFYIFKKYGHDIALKSKNFHLKNINRSRYFKFNYIIKNIPDENNISIKKLDNTFDRFVSKKIKMLKISPYLLQFLKKNKSKYKFFISTATPQKKVNQILKEKNLHKYFNKIYGYPKSKKEHIYEIKKNKQSTIFIGDSYSDYLVAKYTKTFFILKINSENYYFRNKFKMNKINSFKFLDQKLVKNKLQ